MANIHKWFSKLFHFILILIFIPCGKSTKLNPIFFNFNQIKDIVFGSITDESHNWMNNRECFSELLVIKNAFNNFDEWAIEMVDSWGNFPSGTMSGNFFDLGSFSQCFHIARNGSAYSTQYCIGQLKFRGQIETNTVKPQLDVGPGISIGLCLPRVCLVDHLESLIDGTVRSKSSDLTFMIPKNTCQSEENISELTPIDFFTIGLFGAVLLLILMSTGYDIVSRMNDRKRVSMSKTYQPLLAFSAYSNGIKLFSCKNSSSTEQVDCLHGIRSIATMWIALAHLFNFYLWLPIRNRATMNEFMTTYRSMVWFSALIVVDTFLVLSGLLTAINMLTLLKRNRKLNTLSLYLHRYLRVTPLLGVCVLVSLSLLRFMGNGPIWPISVDFLSGNCKRYWWSTLLHIQNYVNPGEICLPNTWFISVDMQLFIVSPFAVRLLHRFKTKAVMVLFALILGCIGLTLALHVHYNLTLLLTNRKIEIAYFPTHVRYSSWLIGIITGYIFIEFPRNSIRIPKILNLFAWTLSIAAMLSVVFSNHPFYQINQHLTPLHYGLYDAFSRVFWSIALCYIIFACYHNYGGPINWFLSHHWWQPLSKLSYTICLIHYPILNATMFTLNSLPHFGEMATICQFITIYLLCIIVAIIGTLAFEAPIISVAKLCFDKRRDSDSINTTHMNRSKKNI